MSINKYLIRGHFTVAYLSHIILIMKILYKLIYSIDTTLCIHRTSLINKYTIYSEYIT